MIRSLAGSNPGRNTRRVALWGIALAALLILALLMAGGCGSGAAVSGVGLDRAGNSRCAEACRIPELKTLEEGARPGWVALEERELTGLWTTLRACQICAGVAIP